MPATLEQTAIDALSLAERERAQLAHVLIASLGTGDGNFSDEWDAEICRRVDEINRGTARGRPATDIVREIRARYE